MLRATSYEGQLIILDKLKEIKNLLNGKDSWIKECYAGRRNNFDFTELSFNDSEANCFCLLGAIKRATCKNSYDVREEILKIINIQIKSMFPVDRSYSDMNIVEFNDYDKTTHKDVIDVLNQSICVVENNLENWES